MIAVDTNILVYAHRAEAEHHDAALTRLKTLAEGLHPWGLPASCLTEFLRVVTHPRVFDPPSTLEEGLAFIEAILGSPTVRLLLPGARFPGLLGQACTDGAARGNLVFDAQIVAICLENGVRHLLSMDRDFTRFRRISVDRL